MAGTEWLMDIMFGTNQSRVANLGDFSLKTQICGFFINEIYKTMNHRRLWPARNGLWTLCLGQIKAGLPT
jgi:hypothetical protein